MKWIRMLLLVLLLSWPFAPARAETAAGHVISTGEMTIEGGIVRYHRVGEGPAVLLLHGLFADKEQWGAVMLRLSGAGYTAIAPDLPGYGRSVGFSIGDYALERQVILLRAFVDRLGIEKCDVAGNSMGGTIAALFREAYPGRIRSLAFIGAPFGVIGWGPLLKKALLEGINPFIPIDTDQFDLEISLLFADPPPISPAVKEMLVSDYVKRNRHYQQVWNIVGLYDTALHDLMENRAVPTLALWGREDAVFHCSGAERLRNIFPIARVRILPGTGHLPHVEDPEATARSYLDFLDANAAQRLHGRKKAAFAP